MKGLPIIIVIVSLLALAGCSPRVVTVPVATHDTLYIAHQQRDSIMVHDSIYMHEYQRGETIYVDRWRYREIYTDRLLHDTIYQSRTDTTTVVATEQAGHRHDRVCKWISTFFSLLAIGILIFGIYYEVTNDYHKQ